MVFLTRRKTITAALLVMFSLPLAGCFEDFAGPYDGPDQVEFEQVNGQYARAVLSTPNTINLQVNLIGPHRATATQVEFRVLGDGTTAQEGVHYSLPNGNMVTIPANSSFGSVTVELLGGEIPPCPAAGATAACRRTLQMELIGSPDGSVGAAENFKRFNLILQSPNNQVAATVTCPATLEVGEEGTFTSARNANATGPITSSWNFGDNTTAQGTQGTHTFNTVGTYTVTFTAAGPFNTSTATCSVAVTAPEED